MFTNTFVRNILQVRKMDRGKLLEKAVRSSGYTLTQVAKRFKLNNRQFLYTLFKNPNIPLEQMVEYGRQINYDFSKEIPEIRKLAKMYMQFNESSSVEEGIEDYTSVIAMLNECKAEKERLNAENAKLKDDLLQLHKEHKLLISRNTPNNSNSHEVDLKN